MLTRSESARSSSSAATTPSINRRLESTDEPPSYIIDLSLPPKQRYLEICAAFKHKLSGLATLYDETLALFGIPWFGRVLLNNVILRRVHSREETAEIRSIAKAVGAPVHLVVAYNTLLDLFSGCMSAGVRVRDAGDGRGKLGMVHLRGLDWDMEPLREMIINVQYVRNGTVIARAVTYAGYTGILTGVREGLSISFNYRASITSSSSLLKHRIHQILMLLGFRRSVPSHLRRILLSPGPPQTLDDINRWLNHPATRLSSCYLTFCSPSAVLVAERDLADVKVSTSITHMAVTNHDVDMENLSRKKRKELLHQCGFDARVVNAVVEHSVERKKALVDLAQETESDGTVRRTMKDAKSWLEMEPIKNEMTHFSCIMDPSVKGGGLVWVQRYPYTSERMSESWEA